jgi:hypothetical protein
MRGDFSGTPEGMPLIRIAPLKVHGYLAALVLIGVRQNEKALPEYFPKRFPSRQHYLG